MEKFLGPFALCACLFTAAFCDELRLKDGSVLRGDLVYASDSVVVFRAGELGEVRVNPAQIEGEAVPSPEARRQPGQDEDPSGQALFFMPTAFTPPKGSVVFRDFELLFLTLGYSPTNTTSIVAGAMLPFTSEFNAVTLGVKQGLYQKANGAIALAGNVTIPISNEINEAAFLWLLNAVASYRFADQIGVHVAAGGIGLQGSGEHTQSLSMGFGTDVRLFPHLKFIGEVLHGGTTFDPGSDGTLVDFGIRIYGERLSADIAGVRSLDDNMGDLWFLPLVSIGYRF